MTSFPCLHDCVRCQTSPAGTEDGYCAHCQFAVRVKVEDGFMRLCEYLRAYQLFAAWERTHG